MESHQLPEVGGLPGGEARELYRGLLNAPWPAVSDCPEAALQELLDLGLVRVQDDRVVGVSPDQGLFNLMDVLYGQCRRTLTRLAEATDFLSECGRSQITRTPAADDGSGGTVRVVTDAEEVLRLSATIPCQAQRTYCSVQTSSRIKNDGFLMIGPSARPTDDVDSRIIVDRGSARDDQVGVTIAAGISRGEHVRCHPAPPLKYMLVDGSLAMLPLDESGSAGAVVIESTAIGTLLAWAFEHLWDEAEPFSQVRSRPVGLDAVHVRILRMLADDSSDAAMAAALDVSDRSLRRHIAALTERLGVNSRYGAVAAAFRLGFLP